MVNGLSSSISNRFFARPQQHCLVRAISGRWIGGLGGAVLGYIDVSETLKLFYERRIWKDQNAADNRLTSGKVRQQLGLIGRNACIESADICFRVAKLLGIIHSVARRFGQNSAVSEISAEVD